MVIYIILFFFCWPYGHYSQLAISLLFHSDLAGNYEHIHIPFLWLQADAKGEEAFCHDTKSSVLVWLLERTEIFKYQFPREI